MRILARSEWLRLRLPPGHLGVIEAAGRIAGETGGVCCLVGGTVRDLLLGRAVSELDLVVEGSGPGFAARLARETGGLARSPTPFGTSKVDLPGGRTVDVAAARRETYAAPAALPSVSPGGLAEDLRRRDFTINAMAIHLEPVCFGALRDPCGGLKDLRRSLVRVLHPRSFLDDPTRIYRALRFAARLGFAIEPQTQAWMEEAVREGLVGRLSPARLTRELRLLLAEVPLLRTADLLDANALLGDLVGGAGPPRPDQETLARLDAMIEETRGLADRRHLSLLPLFLWAVFRPGIQGGAMRQERARLERFAIGLELRKEERRVLQELESPLEALVGRLRAVGGSRSGIYLALHGVSIEQMLGLVSAEPGLAPAVRLHLTELRGVRLETGGDELIRLGIPPGPLLGRILQEILVAKLEGRIHSREEEVDLARRLASEPAPPDD